MLATSDDTKEKTNIGMLWEEKSDGKALFLMAEKKKGGLSVREQILAKIEKLNNLEE